MRRKLKPKTLAYAPGLGLGLRICGFEAFKGSRVVAAVGSWFGVLWGGLRSRQTQQTARPGGNLLSLSCV